jgi:hypothetical protein
VGSPYRARLARRLTVLTETARRRVWERQHLRDNAAASASIRAALAEADIDPARTSCLRHFADAEPRLLGLGDTPALRRADAAFIAAQPRPASKSLAVRAAEEAPRFAGRGRPPPESGASLLDWYAWSLAAGSTPDPDVQRP